MTRECPDCGAEFQVVRFRGADVMRCPWTTGAWWVGFRETVARFGLLAACGRPYQRSRDAGWIER